MRMMRLVDVDDVWIFGCHTIPVPTQQISYFLFQDFLILFFLIFLEIFDYFPFSPAKTKNQNGDFPPNSWPRGIPVVCHQSPGAEQTISK